MEAKDINIVKNKAKPTYSNMVLDGTSFTFKILLKIKSRVPIIYGKTLFNFIILTNSNKHKIINI
jgi:CRISPR/Cas system CSM-associated protein Csm3 (group 7 of RAMP superfamily)